MLYLSAEHDSTCHLYKNTNMSEWGHVITSTNIHASMNIYIYICIYLYSYVHMCLYV